ncbi:MAG: LPS export ABC transporter periplasmic protein LptC [Candidatus Cloacimonetes bacterium]|nr:LPS export ABC transporter periplasmic protein LptC [Candidatus Cloacimonadota bacterium]
MKLITILIITYFIFSCQNNENENSIKENQILKSIEITDSIVVYNSSQDKIGWILKADYLIKLTDENRLNFKKIKLEILNQEGIVSSTIYADSAEVDDNKNMIIAKGNIKVFSQEGDLFGNTLTWDRNKDKIYSDEWIKIIKDGNTIWGERLRTDSNFEHVVIQKASAEGEISESQIAW